MIPNKFHTLISALSEKTSRDGAFWMKTSNPTEYKLRLETAFITIGYVNDKEGKSTIDFNVYNLNGDIQDSIKVGSSSEDYNNILAFYNLVQISFSKIDPFFSTLLNEIQHKPKIGDRRED